MVIIHHRPSRCIDNDEPRPCSNNEIVIVVVAVVIVIVARLLLLLLLTQTGQSSAKVAWETKERGTTKRGKIRSIKEQIVRK